MRLAFIDQPLGAFTVPPNNSVAIWVYEVARRLARAHDVLVVTRRGGRQPETEQVTGLQVRRVRLARERRGLGRVARLIENRINQQPAPYASRWYYFDYAVQAARAAQAWRADIIHLQNFSQFAPVVRAFNPRAKIVLHMHCAWLTELEAPLIAERLQSVDTVLGCCAYLTDGVRARFPQSAAHCHTVLNGVDTATLTPHDDVAASAGQRILFVGRVSPEKGLHVLIEALGQVAGQFPQARLEVVGSHKQLPLEFLLSLSRDPAVQNLAAFYNGSDTSYFHRLEKQLQTLGLTERVTFAGPIPYSQIVERYRMADVYVQPSFSEAFPIPVPEAMAAGLPVIASRIGGIPEAVAEGQTGLLVERGDVNGLAAALSRLLADADLRRTMGTAAQDYARQHFAWDTIADETQQVYEKLRSDSKGLRGL